MKVTIWDLDYYYAKSKTNCFNPDVMKIASYHKQLGDSINFVVKDFDIFRPYDLYYIIKEKEKTPNPPTKFYLDSNVRWWGKAVKLRINWKMSDAMLGCRPDYLLYPEHNTRLERAEQIRLFNNRAEPLKWMQDWTNTYKNKEIIVTDPYIWCASKNNLIKALNLLSELPKVSFLEPIWIQKVISDEDIKQAFLNLNFKKGSLLKWSTINTKQYADVMKFILEFKDLHPTVGISAITVDYRDKNANHWEDKNNALNDFTTIINLCEDAKTSGYNIEIKMPNSRFETPYFALFEELASWTKYSFNSSWLEYITAHYGKCGRVEFEEYWAHPEKWHEVFRDLLRQTYKYKDFIRHKWKQNYISNNDIPWNLWEKEFKYGI